jgi:hypothetical protein
MSAVRCHASKSDWDDGLEQTGMSLAWARPPRQVVSGVGVTVITCGPGSSPSSAAAPRAATASRAAAPAHADAMAAAATEGRAVSTAHRRIAAHLWPVGGGAGPAGGLPCPMPGAVFHVLGTVGPRGGRFGGGLLAVSGSGRLGFGGSAAMSRLGLGSTLRRLGLSSTLASALTCLCLGAAIANPGLG